MLLQQIMQTLQRAGLFHPDTGAAGLAAPAVDGTEQSVNESQQLEDIDDRELDVQLDIATLRVTVNEGLNLSNKQSRLLLREFESLLAHRIVSTVFAGPRIPSFNMLQAELQMVGISVGQLHHTKSTLQRSVRCKQ